MSDSSFDPQSFLNSQTFQEGSTKISPFPDGDYIAVIEKIDARSGIIGKGDRQGEQWVAIEATFKLTDYTSGDLEEIARNIGREDKLVRQSYFIDIDSNGGIDMSEGKNLRLNRLREAVGQNVSGQPWSPNMLQGAGPLVIRVVQDPREDDPETVYNRVTRTAPMGSTL